MAFSVTTRQPPQKCSLDFDKNDWAGCHPSFGFLMWKIWGFLQLFYAPRVGLKNPSWVSLATISLGVLCYDWPGCKYLANEIAWNKTKPPGARYRRISCKLCSRFCNLNTQLSCSYIEQNQTKLLQKDKSTTTEIFYNLSSVYFIIYYYNIVTFVSLLLGWVLTDCLC